jgi:hypothetical protein
MPSITRGTNWTDGSDNWSTPGNWSAGVPVGGSTVNILETDGIARTINYDYAGTAVAIGSLTVDLTNFTGTSSTILSMAANNLSSTAEFIGDSGSGNHGVGTFNQSGGVNSITSATLDIGYNATDTGYYILSGTGSLSSVLNLNVGYNGTGNFNQSGGTNTILNGTDLYLGSGVGSTGYYTLSNTGTLNSTGPERMGYNGVGYFLQTGGFNNAESNLNLAVDAGTTATYTLMGGSLAVGGSDFLGNDNVGVFNQSGGTQTVAVNLGLGQNAGSTGAYFLSSTGSLSVSGIEYVGDAGNGTFNQSGGSNAVTGRLYIGMNAGTTGTYIFSGGSITATTSEYVGNNGNGTFTQSGGTNTGLGNLYLADNNSSNGTYNLIGGTLAVTGTDYVGNTGVALFFQSGGTHTIGSFLDIGVNAGSVGTFDLSDGTVSAKSTEFVGNAGIGTLTQTGGTNSTRSDLILASSAGSGGTYNLVGGTLAVTASLYVGYGAQGNFNQTGGIATVANGTSLYLGDLLSTSGVYTLSGTGTLSVTGSEYIGVSGTGSFVQTGGMNTTAAVWLNTGSTFSFTGGSFSCGTFNEPDGVALFSSLNLDAADVGVYNLNGGSLTIGVGNTLGTIALSNGGKFSQTAGTLACAMFNQTGGSASFTTLNLGAGGTPTYNFIGGTIDAAELDFNGKPSAFNWIGGTLDLTNTVVFESMAPSNSTSAAFGTTVSLANGQSLNIEGNETVGGPGSFTMTVGDGGTNTINAGASLFVDGNGGGTGYYVLKGTGAVRATGNEYVGENGAGIFNQSGGTNTLYVGSLVVGDGAGSNGIYLLSSGTLYGYGEDANQVSEYIGYSGTGTFTQTGGANVNAQALDIGYLYNSSGLYAFGDPVTLTAAVENVGVNGAGEMNQSGGLNVPGSIVVGSNSNSMGTYILSGGTLNPTAADANGVAEYVGLMGSGTLNQSSGANLVSSGSLVIGFGNRSSGNYLQSGGIVKISTELDIGSLSGATGLYSIGGGTLQAANICVGGTSIGAGGRGNLVVNGASASVNVAGTISVYNTAGSGVSLGLGTINAPAMNLSGGAFNQTGGSATFTKIIGTGAVTITGGRTTLVPGAGRSQVNALNVGATGILDITNNSLEINFSAPGNDPVASITTSLSGGFNGGNWSGFGIVSSTAAAGSPGETLSVGYVDGNNDVGTPAAANQILIQYTLAGDANLDGLVNFQDLVAVVQNFNKAGTDWAHGNFLYGSSTSFADLVAVVQNFNKVLTPAGSSGESLGGKSVPLVSNSDIQLPEPGFDGVAMAVAAGGLARRARRRGRSANMY